MLFVALGYLIYDPLLTPLPCHGVLIVLVVYPQVRVALLTPPVRHDVEWTGISTGQGRYLILEYIDVEIRSARIQLRLFVQQLLQVVHVELEHQHLLCAGVLYFRY